MLFFPYCSKNRSDNLLGTEGVATESEKVALNGGELGIHDV